jgi:recombination protein RecT
MPEPKKPTTPPKTPAKTDLPAKKELSASERFTGMVMSEYQNVVGAGFKGFSERERRMIGGYFIAIDQALAAAELKRNHEKNNLVYSWQNINLPALAKDLAHYARIGLDMSSKNHLFPIPYRDTKNNRYTMTLIPGYEGIRYQALKYALTPPESITVECIYENDTFKVFKKDRNNPIESYEFTVNDPFKRGKLVGVFGYLEFAQESMNKLLVFTTADVLKRKPKYASTEFWDGWTDAMYEKTAIRAICSDKYIPRDPAKIDESYAFVRAREEQLAEESIEAEVNENGNGQPLELPPSTGTGAIDGDNITVPSETTAKPAPEEPIPLTERADAADPDEAF